MKKKVLKKKLQLLAFSFLMCFAVADSSTAAVVLSESFTSCEKPEGWAVENYSGGCAWIFSSNSENHTGGEECFAFADSQIACNEVTETDTSLVTSIIDCSIIKGTVLTFQYDAYATSDTSMFKVELSTDNGATWPVVIWQETASILGPKKTALDISSFADGQPDVRIRFRYTASEPWWWQIDNVKVASKFNWVLFMPAIIVKPIL